MTMHPMLNVAVKAARKAGQIIARASLDIDRLMVSEKRHNDFVTEVDKAAEAAVVEILLDAYPGHAILAEEGGAGGAVDSDYTWIIDPLDGTMNFIHGFPQYCVSIGLRFRDQMQQAVVFDPTRNELFTASKGRGAFMNDRRLRVTKREKMSDALVATGFPNRGTQDLEKYLDMLRTFTLNCADVRRPGAAALDLAYVAAGRVDGFFEDGLAAWDMAAGSLLITEAGGLVGDFAGESGYLNGTQIMAANPKIFAQMVGLLQPYK